MAELMEINLQTILDVYTAANDGLVLKDPKTGDALDIETRDYTSFFPSNQYTWSIHEGQALRIIQDALDIEELLPNGLEGVALDIDQDGNVLDSITPGDNLVSTEVESYANMWTWVAARANEKLQAADGLFQSDLNQFEEGLARLALALEYREKEIAKNGNTAEKEELAEYQSIIGAYNSMIEALEKVSVLNVVSDVDSEVEDEEWDLVEPLVVDLDDNDSQESLQTAGSPQEYNNVVDSDAVMGMKSMEAILRYDYAGAMAESGLGTF